MSQDNSNSKREARDLAARHHRDLMQKAGRNISHSEARKRVDLAMQRTQRKKEG